MVSRGHCLTADSMPERHTENVPAEVSGRSSRARATISLADLRQQLESRQVTQEHAAPKSCPDPWSKSRPFGH